MVTELQFIAVAAFLIWGLAASLCGVLTAAPDTARLVRRHRDVEQAAASTEPSQNAQAAGDRPGPIRSTHF